MALLIVFILLALVCSCDSSLAEVNMTRVEITFSVNVSGVLTRTTWGDTYDSESATAYENAIYSDKFQVLVFDEDSKYIDELDIVSLSSSGNNSNTYTVKGLLNLDKSYLEDNKLSGKLVVLANHDYTISDISSLTDIGSSTFAAKNHRTAEIADGTAGIPMFGVKTFENLSIQDGEATDAGSVYMLRSMAKIRVKLDLDSNGDGSVSSDEEYAITKVTLSNCNDGGYTMPKGYADVDDTKSLTMLGFAGSSDDNTFNQYPEDGTPSMETLTFQKESDTEYYVYVPEYKISNERPLFSIKFDFQTDTDDAYTFSFGEYSDGSMTTNNAYDIERNCCYTFTIKKNKGTFSIETGDWANTFDNEFTFGV